MVRLRIDNRLKTFPALSDNHGRKIEYLRLAITDRCNLRCRYCMPEQGVTFVPYSEILRYEEMVRLVGLFAQLGIRKVRITGGEPFARRDCIPFLQQIRSMPGIRELHVTTNGVATAPHLDVLQKLGISGINLSLDTLDPKRFRQISRHDSLDRVLETFYGALQRNIPLKINTVVLEDTSEEDLRTIAELARDVPVTVRFIEKMPFSGGNGRKDRIQEDLLQKLHRLLPLTEVRNSLPTTARLFSLPGFTGRIGIIEGHSRTFCSTCNKLRITPLGTLKTCLYDTGVLDLKAMLREGRDDRSIRQAIIQCIGNRFSDGLQAERRNGIGHEPSMASIGG